MPRLMTYNVHRCVGTDRRLDVGRIADVIASEEPDIVALQELDMLRARTGMVDQAHEIARRLEMAYHFHPAMKVEEEFYGDAILTRYPERLIQAAPLPSYGDARLIEPRGALWIAVDIDGTWVQIINTHLGLIPREQQGQASALAGPSWTEHPYFTKGPGMLVGDFNATAASVVYRTLTKRLKDARVLDPPPRAPTSTFPSRMPVLRIDHVFVSDEITITDVRAPYNPAVRIASDHCPLIIDFEVGPGPAR